MHDTRPADRQSNLVPSGDQRMTKDERLEIGKVIRAREKVAIVGAKHQALALKAEFERKISAIYPRNHPAWAEATRIAEQAIADANKHIAEQCKKMDVPETFSPRAGLNWASRGENMFSERRAELRKAANALIAEREAEAVHQIMTVSVEMQSQVVAHGLTTDAAKDFLAKLPTPQQLMPPVDMEEAERRRKPLTSSDRYELRHYGGPDAEETD